jgi:hypothetical protein
MELCFLSLFRACSSWLAVWVVSCGFWIRVRGFKFWVISCGLSVNYCVWQLFWMLVYSFWFMVLDSELFGVKLLQAEYAVETRTSTGSVLHSPN